MKKDIVESLISEAVRGNDLKNIADKIFNKERITDADALVLFEKGSLGFLGTLANYIREDLHGDKTYFNRNFHIEPTNVCVFACKFCSYSRLYAHRDEGWELSMQQMLDIVKSYDGKPITEVHFIQSLLHTHFCFAKHIIQFNSSKSFYM